MFGAGKSKPDPKMAPAKLLGSVPMVNESATVEPSGEGMLVSVPMRRPRWLVPPLSWILPFSSHRRVELDALGSSVLRSCDGERTVEEVIERFAEENKLSFRESQLSVSAFLQMLVERGIVVIVGLHEED
jgi:hypothetical protein